jgi:hypothetical protein
VGSGPASGDSPVLELVVGGGVGEQAHIIAKLAIVSMLPAARVLKEVALAILIVCSQCGSEFEPRVNSTKLCSVRCQLMAKVDKSGDCWVFTGSRDADGYGHLRAAGHVHAAHRISWALTFGPIPSDLLVLHRCDNPPCVNPAHLFLGTDADNNADKIAKGRANAPCGARAGNVKLTDADIREIRSRIGNGETQRAVADSMGVCQTAISAIMTGRNWSHVR